MGRGSYLSRGERGELILHLVIGNFHVSQQPLSMIVGTVKPCYYGHHWDKKRCPYYRVSLLSRLILREVYGVGPRKLSVIMSVCIKWVSVMWGFTVSKLPTTCTTNTVISSK